MYPLRIESGRICLREVGVEDREAVRAWTSDPEVVRFLPFGPLVGEELDRYVDQILGEAEGGSRSSYNLVVERVDEGDVIGAVSLTIDSELHRRAELGFVLQRRSWGQGYASEAAGALADFAFDHLGIHRVWAICATANAASVKVLERIGMVREGTLREHLLVGDVFHDTYLYGRVATGEYL